MIGVCSYVAAGGNSNGGVTAAAVVRCWCYCRYCVG